MTNKKKPEIEYRDAILPGLGTVKVPAHMTDAEVLAEVENAKAEETAPAPAKRTKPKR
jgi:hypothetical protein